jgi:hypothetical protein
MTTKETQLKQDIVTMTRAANQIAMNPLDPGEDVIEEYLSARQRLRQGENYRRSNHTYSV